MATTDFSKLTDEQLRNRASAYADLAKDFASVGPKWMEDASHQRIDAALDEMEKRSK